MRNERLTVGRAIMLIVFVAALACSSVGNVSAETLSGDASTDIKTLYNAWLRQAGIPESNRFMCSTDAACARRAEMRSWLARTGDGLGEQCPEHLPLTDEIADQIVWWSVQRDLDPLLVLALIYTESRLDPYARSEAGALGLMQIMPLHFTGQEWPLDYATNIGKGTELLAESMAEFGALDVSLAGYNAGVNTIYRYGGIPPVTETRVHIERVMRCYDRLVDAAGSLQRASVRATSRGGVRQMCYASGHEGLYRPLGGGPSEW